MSNEAKVAKAKVVQLREGASGHRAPLPGSLVRLRDASAQGLRHLLDGFFDASDDALFSMADKTGSNQEQTAYFDAMRELRLQRKHLTLSMLQWQARAFNEIGRFSPKSAKSAVNSVDSEELSLMDNDQLEVQVALENMSNKVLSLHSEQILLLHMRFCHLCGPSLNLSQMPLSPDMICYGLSEACADLDVDIRAKLIILKLFDKSLVGQLDQLYQDANNLLVQEGVLPELKHKHALSRRKQTATRSGASASGTEPDDATQGPTFDELANLLHGGTTAAQSAAGAGSFNIGRIGKMAGLGTGAFVSTGQLLNLLSHQKLHSLVADSAISGPLAGESLQARLQQVLMRQSVANGAVQQVDADVINLVSMLFDFILEDRQLPEVMKALLARLQIPILKVALLDRSFFNRGGHPARKLLNELAMAAIGWNERNDSARDPLRSKIEYVVDQLLNQFTDNVDIFQTLLDDFSHFADLEQRRRELVEQRLRDAEEGRARNELAKEQAQQVITAAQKGRQLHESVAAILGAPWSKVLQWTFLREGLDSKNWAIRSKVAQQLVWSVDPAPVTATTRTDLLKAIPYIVDAVRQGLQLVSWDPFAVDKLIRDLELAHVDALQALFTHVESTHVESAHVEGAHVEGAHVEGAHVESSQVETAQPASTPVEVPASTTEVTLLTDEFKSLQDAPKIASADTIDLLEFAPPTAATQASQVVGQALEARTPAVAPLEQSEWLARADQLCVGSWVEIDEGGERKLRCKLAAVIKSTGKYIFVNRTGNKVAEYLREDVAAAIADKKLNVLDDGLIFDRALESIIDNLRVNRRD